MTEESVARRIGGSMIAKILKKSKWGTPLDAYLELTGERVEPEKTGEDIDRGNFLEPAIRDWASKKTGEKFVKTIGFALPEWDWATVRPDGIALPTFGQSGGVLLEIKAPRRDDALLWGEEGTDEVPVDPLLQTHWGMMVTNTERGVVASLLGGELRIYNVARDRELEAKMLARAKEFVSNHVVPRVPPPAEFGDDHNILYMHPKNTLPLKEWSSLSPQSQLFVKEYLASWSEENAAWKRLEAHEPVIKELIGPTDGIALPPEIGSRVSWKANATAGTSWKALAESLLAKLPDEEVARLKIEFAGTPTRVLRPWLNKGTK